MQEHSFHQEGSDLGGSPKGGEGKQSGQTPMGTPVLPKQVEADYRDETIQSFAQSILRLGQECRALADENKNLKAEVELLTNCKSEADRLKAEVERLTALIESNLNSSKVAMGKADAVLYERDSLKAEVERLERQVNYWKIEAECDHGRWQRCLEDLEHLRRLK
jgi:cell shape-determining protein MreC